MAANTRDEVHKKQLEEMADAWSMLAREREKHLRKQANAPINGSTPTR
jgi:hypothetical protein